MLTPTEAAKLIVEHCAPLPPERRPLKEALDLVLAEDVASPIDLPAWDNSAMDGYAVRAADVAGATRERGATLRVIETVPAGGFPEPCERMTTKASHWRMPVSIRSQKGSSGVMEWLSLKTSP